MAISPLSIYMALAMTQAITTGDTKSEILEALDMTDDEVSGYTRSVYNYSNNTKYNDDNNLVLKELLSNSIWLDNNLDYKSQALGKLANYYGANSYSVDFDGNNKNANEIIRQYVKDNTEDLIDRDFDLGKETVFALINTLYFKDAWHLDLTTLEESKDTYLFTNSDGSQTNEKLLLANYIGGLAVDKDTYRAFFTSTEGNYRISFVVPKEGYDINDIFTADTISYVSSKEFRNEAYSSSIGDHVYNYTRCVFPEFEASFSTTINEAIKALGIESAFKKVNDFTPITDKAACVGNIFHATCFEAKKDGMEGAASTVVGVSTAAAYGDVWTNAYYDFIVNKSFGFAVVDKNDVPVFTGIVNNI